MEARSDRPLALAFGAVAETYDRVRPRYLLPLLDRAEEALELQPAAHVLDLGAGTGRLTRELSRRFASVFAVDPDEEMRRLIGVGTVLAGTAEAIPLDDARVDAVFVAEAFHWFEAERAIAEIARVLRARGGLAVVSTPWWTTEPPLPEEVVRMLRAPFDRTSDRRRPRWDRAFADSPFEPLRYEQFEESITVDVDTLLALYTTTSALAALDTAERTSLLAGVHAHLAGPYRLPIKHELSWTRLT